MPTSRTLDMIRGGPGTESHFLQENLCCSSIWLQNFLAVTLENLILCQGVLGHLFCPHVV